MINLPTDVGLVNPFKCLMEIYYGRIKHILSRKSLPKRGFPVLFCKKDLSGHNGKISLKYVHINQTLCLNNTVAYTNYEDMLCLLCGSSPSRMMWLTTIISVTEAPTSPLKQQRVCAIKLKEEAIKCMMRQASRMLRVRENFYRNRIGISRILVKETATRMSCLVIIGNRENSWIKKLQKPKKNK